MRAETMERPEERVTRNWIGMTFTTLLQSKDTGGSLGVVEIVSNPGSGPPRHVHHVEDETFILLSGEMELWIAGETVVKSAGDVVFIPRGVEHAFKVISDHPCRHYLIVNPGGFEGFFEEMGACGARIPEDMHIVIEAGTRHNMTFTGPPL